MSVPSSMLTFALLAIALVYPTRAVADGSKDQYQVKAFSAVDYQTLYSFNKVTFRYKDEQRYKDTGLYRKAAVAGIKLDATGREYVSIPRWKGNIPATLGWIMGTDGDWLVVSPYPSWAMNEIGNKDKLQSVLGFEIDSLGRMWILDQGKINSEAAIPGSIKLVIWDMNTNKLIRTHTFSNDVAGLCSSFLNDIVVDTVDEVAYISDSGLPCTNATDESVHGGIIVYDYKTDTSKRVIDSNEPTVQPTPGFLTMINGKKFKDQVGADGIALSSDRKSLIYTALSSTTLATIPTKYLTDWSYTQSQVYDQIVSGTRGFSSDGFTTDNRGNLYCTDITGYGQIQMASYRQLFLGQFSGNGNQMWTVFGSANSTVWPDTIAWDNTTNSIVFTSNNLNTFLAGEMNFDKPSGEATNFNIFRLHVNSKSYLEEQGESHPRAYPWINVDLQDNLMTWQVVSGGVPLGDTGYVHLQGWYQGKEGTTLQESDAMAYLNKMGDFTRSNPVTGWQWIVNDNSTRTLAGNKYLQPPNPDFTGVSVGTTRSFDNPPRDVYFQDTLVTDEVSYLLFALSSDPNGAVQVKFGPALPWSGTPSPKDSGITLTWAIVIGAGAFLFGVIIVLGARPLFCRDRGSDYVHQAPYQQVTA